MAVVCLMVLYKEQTNSNITTNIMIDSVSSNTEILGYNGNAQQFVTDWHKNSINVDI